MLLAVCCFLFLLPVLLNYFSYPLYSRWLVCVLPPVSLVALSVTNKRLYPATISAFNYYDVRFFLIVCMVVPLMVIQIKEKKILILALAVSALALILLDPVFYLMGVSYERLVGPASRYYYSANFFSIMSYSFMLLALLFEKKISNDTQQNNDTLIAFLNNANAGLEKQKKEIEEQNKEIRQQAKELLTHQEQLLKANHVIEQQKEALLEIQSGLRSELTERNKELVQSNEQLIKSNIELQQFSYSISHNLRGPLARMLGLTNLMEKDLNHLSGAQHNLVKLVAQSAHELDDVIRDLGKIIDIRNDLQRIREKISFQSEWEMVLRSLSAFILPDMKIESDFSRAPVVYAVRPLLTSILYNLCSNAIKYRSPVRPLHLQVSTYTENDLIVLKISDNGLGLDLAQFNRNIFGLYKRFHTHTEGKGLGLYLVKLQAELLGGKVEVSSELHVGTTFLVSLKEPEELDEQIFFERDYATLFYNARLGCVGIYWKKQPTGEEYRQLFTTSLELIRQYRSTLWFSDFSKQGTVATADQQWMVSTIMAEAVRNGLQKIANVPGNHQSNQEYLSRIKQGVEANGIECRFFATRQEAMQWLEQFANTPH